MTLTSTVRNEGFTSEIWREFDSDQIENCWFIGDADIDADGANGQNGARPAYMVGNLGSELLGNGGMAMSNGRVIGAASWFRDIVIIGPDGQPKVFPGGIIASKTSYRFKGLSADDPVAYVDSETVPYICVPPEILSGTVGAVKGCRARATYNGTCVLGIVADTGPRKKVGEVSIAMARALHMPSNPRSGGIDSPRVLYELWPGVPGEINGVALTLMRSNGSYVA